MIAEHVIAQLRDRVDIVGLALELGLDLRQRGASWWGCCPFHQERSPSFKVDSRSQHFKCFGCGRGGDALALLQELGGLSFPEAAAELGRRCGVEVEGGAATQPSRLRSRRRPTPRPARPEPRKRAAVADLWGRSLAAIRGADGLPVRAYLGERLGGEVADAALELGLVGALPLDARWPGQRLQGPHRLVSPLYELPPAGAPVRLEDQQPCDLALRAICATKPKVKSLREAAPSVVRSFGQVGAALADADGHELAVIEGQLNALVWAVALHPDRSWIGLHGVGAAASIAERLRDEVLALRREGVGGPARLVIDTDLDSGDEAAAIFADLSADLGIPAQRVDRAQGEIHAQDPR